MCYNAVCDKVVCVCVPILCVKELCVCERVGCETVVYERVKRERKEEEEEEEEEETGVHNRKTETPRKNVGNHIPKKLLVSHPHFATYSPFFRRSSSERSRVKKHMRCGGRQFSGSRATANLGFRRRTQSTAPAQRRPGHCGSNGQAPPFTSMCKYKLYK